MTMGYDNYVAPELDHHRAFMNQHWINKWQVSVRKPENLESTSVEHSLKPSAQNLKTLRQEDEHISTFHTLLSKKFLDSFQSGLIAEHPKFRMPRQDEGNYRLDGAREKEYKSANTGFVEGHTIEFSAVEVESPIVMVNMYQHIDYEDCENGKRLRPWWMPIEQIFWYPTLGNYRNAAALLKTWGPYSNLAIGVVPQQATMKFKAGLIAPKFFPRPDDPIGNNLIDLGARLSFSEAEQDISQEYVMSYVREVLTGGSIQFYVYHAEPGYIFDIGKTVNLDEELAHAPRKKGSNSKLNNWWRQPKEKKKFYLTDPSYDQSKIDLVAALHNQKIINDDEQKDFMTVLKEVVGDSA